MGDIVHYGQGPSSAGEVMVDVVSSLVGAFLQRAVMAPSYRITVLTAVEGELIRSGRLPKSGFGGLCACVKRVYTKEGVLSFFRGLLMDALFAIPSAIAEEISSALISALVESTVPIHVLQSLPVWAYVTVSLCSTSTAVLLATPVTGLQNTILTNYVADIIAPIEDEPTIYQPLEEEAKTTKENGADVEESYKYESATQAAADIRRRWGWRGFYCGVGIDAMAVFLYRGTYYYALQLLPMAVHDNYPYAISRCLAIAAGCITQPFEVVSRRMMLAASSSRKYNSVAECYRTIVAEEGYTALWSGLRARLIITCVGMAFMELRRLF